jgi:hypothetical protein
MQILVFIPLLVPALVATTIGRVALLATAPARTAAAALGITGPKGQADIPGPGRACPAPDRRPCSPHPHSYATASITCLSLHDHEEGSWSGGGFPLRRDDEQPPGQIAGPFGREPTGNELARPASGAQERQDDRS